MSSQVAQPENKTQVTQKKEKSKKMNKTQRAQTIMPVGRIRRKLIDEYQMARRCRDEAAVAFAAICDEIMGHILTDMTDCASQNKKRRLSSSHAFIACTVDSNLNKIYDGNFPKARRLPNIHEALLPRETRATAA